MPELLKIYKEREIPKEFTSKEEIDYWYGLRLKRRAYTICKKYPHKLKILYECSHDEPKENHHPNYNKPLEVEKLCPKCHWHKKVKKILHKSGLP